MNYIVGDSLGKRHAFNLPTRMYGSNTVGADSVQSAMLSPLLHTVNVKVLHIFLLVVVR